LTNSPPENDSPVALRAATQLSAPSMQQAASAPASAAAAAVRTEPAVAGSLDRGLGREDVTVATLAMSGMVVLAGGWLFRRRRRLAQEPADEAALPQAPAEPAADPESALPREQIEVAQMPEPLAQADGAPEPGPVVREEAQLEPDASLSWAPDPDIAVNSSWATATAPMPRRPSRLGVATQKRLIKSLMWLRTVAGGAAILAAIAVVVFWSIETTDRRAGETGLNMPLLLGALAGWALSWAAGQLANMLHRLFFNRVHPKFDT
jgi:hypothetical protein